MKKLKISFVIYRPNLSGGARVTAKHAQMLKQAGHDVTVTGLGKARPSIREHIRALKKGRIARDTLAYDQHFKDVGIEVKTIDYKDKIDAHDLPDADIVIATFWRTAEWVNALPANKGRKVYFVQSHEIFPQFPEDRVRATYKMPMYKIAIAKWVARIMDTEYDSKNVRVVPNSADFSIFNAPERQKNKTPRIGFLYAHASVKGVDVTIRAIEKIRQTIPDLEIVSFGSVEPNDELPLPSGCKFSHRPPQEKIKDIYASCDLWIVGSRIEGFHLPPIEAMACRTPVVSTRVGGPEDLIVDGKNGYIVDIEDDDTLAARGLEILSSSPETWKTISQAAYETAISFSWPEAGKKFEQALFEAIETPV